MSTFTPQWLHALSPDRRDEVIDWITRCGIAPEACAGFDFDGTYIRAEMYVLDARGQGKILSNGQPEMAGDRTVKAVTPIPEAVQSGMFKNWVSQ